MSDDEFNLFDALMEGSDFETDREQIIKPAFAWTGSKSRSIKNLIPNLPYRKLFVDVCGGSGAVTLARRPSKLDVFNDAYSGVVDFYRCVKDEILLKRMIEWLEVTLFSRELFKLWKSEWKNTVDPAERAAKWYHMLHCSFGSLGRNFGRSTNSGVNRAEQFWNKFELFWPIHNRLKNVQIENLDWEQCIKDYDSHDTVFYIDPPYLYSDVGIYDEAWTIEKHRRLIQVIDQVEGFVALSGYDNEIYNSIKWDDKITWETVITISPRAFTESNNLIGKENVMQKKATEVLWLKNK